jgi:hypothetical protein
MQLVPLDTSILCTKSGSSHTEPPCSELRYEPCEDDRQTSDPHREGGN